MVTAPRLRGCASKNPRQQLPVAARPPVMANGAHVIPGREFLDDFDVRGEAGAREHALEEIVTEEGGVRRTVRERGLERVDVVNALSGIGSFAEQILIDVGDCRGVGIDSADAREDSLEQRAFPAHGQRRRDARLQDRVALDNSAPFGVEARSVQRMGHLADQATHRVARQSRVRVERHDVTNARRRGRRSEPDVDECGVRRGAQQSI